MGTPPPILAGFHVLRESSVAQGIYSPIFSFVWKGAWCKSVACDCQATSLRRRGMSNCCPLFCSQCMCFSASARISGVHDFGPLTSASHEGTLTLSALLRPHISLPGSCWSPHTTLRQRKESWDSVLCLCPWYCSNQGSREHVVFTWLLGCAARSLHSLRSWGLALGLHRPGWRHGFTAGQQLLLSCVGLCTCQLWVQVC